MATRLFNVLLLLTITLVFNIFTSTSILAENALTVAIIPGEGPREVGPEIISGVEVALSREPGLALLERDQVRQILKELHLSAAGNLDPAQTLRMGQILGAQILLII